MYQSKYSANNIADKITKEALITPVEAVETRLCDPEKQASRARPHYNAHESNANKQCMPINAIAYAFNHI